MPSKKLNRYKVTLSISGSVEVFVDAKSAEEAEELAENGECSYSKADIDVNELFVIDTELIRSRGRVSSSN